MKNISDKLNLVIKLFHNGEKEKALDKINLLLNSNKENIDLLFIHAKISMGLNDINEANQSLLKILEIQPNDIKALKLTYVNFFKE